MSETFLWTDADGLRRVWTRAENDASTDGSDNPSRQAQQSLTGRAAHERVSLASGIDGPPRRSRRLGHRRGGNPFAWRTAMFRVPALRKREVFVYLWPKLAKYVQHVLLQGIDGIPPEGELLISGYVHGDTFRNHML